MSSRGKRQQTLLSSMGRRTGRGTRPPLVDRSHFVDYFGDASGAGAHLARSLAPREGHDDNQRRLIQAINSAKESYGSTSSSSYEKRAGYVNEARQYFSVLSKYNRMSSSEKADRVYLPQTTFFHDDRRDRFRRPDMVKLKRIGTGGGERYEASAIEFKSNSFDEAQRSATIDLMASPAKLRFTQNMFPPRLSEDREDEITQIESHNSTLTKYKTRFSGGSPVTSEPSSSAGKLSATSGGTFIRGTHVKVETRRD